MDGRAVPKKGKKQHRGPLNDGKVFSVVWKGVNKGRAGSRPSSPKAFFQERKKKGGGSYQDCECQSPGKGKHPL